MDQHCFIAVRHPLASTASSTPPLLPLGDETPVTKEELQQQQRQKNVTKQNKTNRTKKKTATRFMDTATIITTEELQQLQRQKNVTKQNTTNRTERRKKQQQGSWTQQRSWTHLLSWTHQGPWLISKENDKEDDQPPRVRRTKQASPPYLQNIFLCFHLKTHPFNIVREQKRQSNSNRVRRKAGTCRVG